MLDPEDFNDVFGSHDIALYDNAVRRSITKARNDLHGRLFIDRLLEAIGISKGM